MVMEYVPGPSLQDRIDQHGPLALAEVLRIGMQTAAGLAARRYAQGLVHRGTSSRPTSCWRTASSGSSWTDFGFWLRAAADAGMTQSGVLAGTPQYMAPEQARHARGDRPPRRPVQPGQQRLYAMCTGIPPFRAETPVAVLRRVSDDVPRPIRQLNPEVPAPGSKGDRLSGCIAKDPADQLRLGLRCWPICWASAWAYVQEPLTEVLALRS